MMTNADCTLYLYDKATGGYTRYFISGVYWRENKAGNVLKSGLQTADSTTVYLYSDKVVPDSPTNEWDNLQVYTFSWSDTYRFEKTAFPRFYPEQYASA